MAQITGCAVVWEPRSKEQAAAQRLYRSSHVLFLLGPAGSGKTIAAVGLAALDVVGNGTKTNNNRKIVAIRPTVEAGAGIGFLKGTLEEKIDPYMAPIRQNLAKVALNFPGDKIQFDAVSFIRGITYEDCIVIVDEAQNLTYGELVLVLTRLGRGSKLIFCGDPDQPDIKPTGNFPTDLEEVVYCLEDIPGVSVVDFPEDESLRHPLIGPMLKALREKR